MLAQQTQNKYQATDGGEIKFSTTGQMLDDMTKHFEREAMIKIQVNRNKGPLLKENQAADLAAKDAAVIGLPWWWEAAL